MLLRVRVKVRVTVWVALEHRLYNPDYLEHDLVLHVAVVCDLT